MENPSLASEKGNLFQLLWLVTRGGGRGKLGMDGKLKLTIQ